MKQDMIVIPVSYTHLDVYKRQDYKRYDKYEETHVINAYERCVFEYEDENVREHIS